MEKSNKEQFSKEAIKNFIGLHHALLKVHNRLIREGYTITKDKIIPPKDKKKGD